MIDEARARRVELCTMMGRTRTQPVDLSRAGEKQTTGALGLGLAACQRGLSVGFTTAAALVNELMEARDDRRLLNFQKRLLV